MRPSIAVIDPGTRVPELDCFNRMSRVSLLPLSYHLPGLFGLDSLSRSPEDPRAIIVLGSGASVNDDLLWLHSLSKWLLPRMLSGIPTLGICFGHQLVTRLLGGRVGYLHEDHRKELGARVVSLKPNRLWGERTGPLVVTHREAVLEMAPGMTIIGATDACATDVLIHERLPIATLQTHPEATAAFLQNGSVPWPLTEGDLAFGHSLVDTFLARVADGNF